MIGSETYEIIRELFESLFAKISESMRGSEFVFDSFNLLCQKLHKIILNAGESYIDSPE